MAGAMRKMAVYLGLVEDDRDDVDGYFDEEEEWEYEEPAPTRRASRSSSRASERSSRTSSYDRPERADRAEPRTVTVVDPREPRRLYRDEPSNVSAMPTASRDRDYDPEPAPPVDLHRITTIHPHTYNDARRIGEEFRQGIPVIMNLTEMDWCSDCTARSSGSPTRSSCCRRRMLRWAQKHGPNSRRPDSSTRVDARYSRV
jgi:cell division inhibitor SepF